MGKRLNLEKTFQHLQRATLSTVDIRCNFLLGSMSYSVVISSPLVIFSQSSHYLCMKVWPSSFFWALFIIWNHLFSHSWDLVLRKQVIFSEPLTCLTPHMCIVMAIPCPATPWSTWQLSTHAQLTWGQWVSTNAPSPWNKLTEKILSLVIAWSKCLSCLPEPPCRALTLKPVLHCSPFLQYES